MNSKVPTNKICMLDHEINLLSKILFVLMLIIAMSIVLLNGFHGEWLMFYFRVVLLLSSIIPISLRVNLDLAKMWYSYCIN
jgi:phospholipid-translocating ATPase